MVEGKRGGEGEREGRGSRPTQPPPWPLKWKGSMKVDLKGREGEGGRDGVGNFGFLSGRKVTHTLSQGHSCIHIIMRGERKQ